MNWTELCRKIQNAHIYMPSMHLEISTSYCGSPCVRWTTFIHNHCYNFWFNFNNLLLLLHNISSTATLLMSTFISKFQSFIINFYVYYCIYVLLSNFTGIKLLLPLLLSSCLFHVSVMEFLSIVHLTLISP